MDEINGVDQELSQLRGVWEGAGQGHVFKWVDTLNEQQKRSFLTDLKKVDVVACNNIHERTKASVGAVLQGRAKAPLPRENVVDLAQATQEQRNAWHDVGYDLISGGKVALLLLAGGQATRLGCLVPKGMFDLGLPSHKSLYQLQAERLVKLQRLVSIARNTPNVTIPWYIMTSAATHRDTVAYFTENNFFGLDKSNVVFFEQLVIPCYTPDGKFILESASKLALAPNGNGGLFQTLKNAGVLEDMQRRGVEYVSQYCVDNVLIKVADPVFIGFMHTAHADCAAKVTAKAYPEEPVGVVCLCDGQAGVVEYSEIDAHTRNLRNDDGQLVFNEAHLCINTFTRGFLENIAQSHLDALPYHVAVKKIPSADESGRTVTPPQPNGWKLELFIFDVFAYANKLVALKIQRDEEFSPLKNGAGPKDSPQSCLADLVAYHKKLITKAGGTVVTGGDGIGLCEISPVVSYDGEGLEIIVQGKTFETPFEIK